MILKRIVTLYTWSMFCWLPYSIRCWVLLAPGPNTWWAWSFSKMNQFYVLGLVLLWAIWGLYNLHPHRWCWWAILGIWGIITFFIHSISWQAYWLGLWSWVDVWALVGAYLGVFWIGMCYQQVRK